MVTRVWHAVDVGIGIYAVKKQPSILNWVRLLFAIVGLGGNYVLAKMEAKSLDKT